MTIWVLSLAGLLACYLPCSATFFYKVLMLPYSKGYHQESANPKSNCVYQLTCYLHPGQLPNCPPHIPHHGLSPHSPVPHSRYTMSHRCRRVKHIQALFLFCSQLICSKTIVKLQKAFKNTFLNLLIGISLHE